MSGIQKEEVLTLPTGSDEEPADDKQIVPQTTHTPLLRDPIFWAHTALTVSHGVSFVHGFERQAQEYPADMRKLEGYLTTWQVNFNFFSALADTCYYVKNRKDFTAGFSQTMRNSVSGGVTGLYYGVLKGKNWVEHALTTAANMVFSIATGSTGINRKILLVSLVGSGSFACAYGAWTKVAYDLGVTDEQNNRYFYTVMDWADPATAKFWLGLGAAGFTIMPLITDSATRLIRYGCENIIHPCGYELPRIQQENYLPNFLDNATQKLTGCVTGASDSSLPAESSLLEDPENAAVYSPDQIPDFKSPLAQASAPLLGELEPFEDPENPAVNSLTDQKSGSKSSIEKAKNRFSDGMAGVSSCLTSFFSRRGPSDEKQQQSSRSGNFFSCCPPSTGPEESPAPGIK